MTRLARFLWVSLVAAALAACSPNPGGETRSQLTISYADDVENGIRCYGWYGSTKAISCVKIDP